MLWYKGWLETRLKLLFLIGFMGLILGFLHWVRNPAIASGARSPVLGFILFSNPTFVSMICALLAGAGIVTQPVFQATKGLHGSTLFTLSMPVSRFRLLAVRVSVGWLQAAALIGTFCYGLWLVSPALRAMATRVEIVEYAGILIVCSTALYLLSVLLGTFLDDQWRTWGSVMVFMGLWVLPKLISLPASVDIFRAMGEGSPLIAHAIPWGAMIVSLVFAALLFLAAVKVVQTRQY